MEIIVQYILVCARYMYIVQNRQHNGQKEKLQKDKQRSTKHTHKAKDRLC
jgi:hypothetical protein